MTRKSKKTLKETWSETIQQLKDSNFRETNTNWFTLCLTRKEDPDEIQELEQMFLKEGFIVEYNEDLNRFHIEYPIPGKGRLK